MSYQNPPGRRQMPDLIPPNRQALAEALALSAEVLRNVELSELPLTNIALKASRLARLLNDFDVQKIMEYEAGGYPHTPSGLPPETWHLAVAAGRKFEFLYPKTNEPKEYVFIESIAELEALVRSSETSLAAARDPDVAISSANPYQSVMGPVGNIMERTTIRGSIAQATKRLAGRRVLIYQYVLRKHYELKFSGVADDVFSRIRQKVDVTIGRTISAAVQRLSAVYENLSSENPEDWSNAVHSCRRILEDLADAVFPPTDEERTVETEGKGRRIKLGKDNYINRIMAFVQDANASRRFQDLVGSHLTFLGDRLDRVFQAAQKGSHATIVSREEADRYVMYTYMLVGDILSLRESLAESERDGLK
jgi:hypothetical protein